MLTRREALLTRREALLNLLLLFVYSFDILDKLPPKLEAFSMEKPISFLKEVREELDKVVWPTKEQTIRYTALVIMVAVATGLFLGGLDYLLTLLTTLILENYGR